MACRQRGLLAKRSCVEKTHDSSSPSGMQRLKSIQQALICFNCLSGKNKTKNKLKQTKNKQKTGHRTAYANRERERERRGMRDREPDRQTEREQHEKKTTTTTKQTKNARLLKSLWHAKTEIDSTLNKL